MWDEYDDELYDVDELQNALPLSLTLTADSPEVHRLAKYIYDKYIHRRYCPRYDRLAPAITCVIMNLLWAYETGKDVFVRYSRHTEDYNSGRYNPLGISYRLMMNRVISALDRHLIESVTGSQLLGLQSRMRALPLLIDLADRFKVRPDAGKRSESEETIILKGFKVVVGKVSGQEVRRAPLKEYEDTEETRRMRENLTTINGRLARANIELAYTEDVVDDINEDRQRRGEDEVGEPKVNYRRCRLVRIFNDCSFELGGRFYKGWWQEIPKQFRAFIQIDGYVTVELDYSGIHYAILYAEAGEELPEDPYQLPNLDPIHREAVKIALNTTVNAKDRRQANAAIKYRLRKKGLKQPPAPYETPSKLRKAVEAQHPVIAEKMCTGEGKRLMNVDSKIAEHVLLSLGSQDITVLPVHDSFITAKHEVPHLELAMADAFNEITGATCKVDRKKPVWEKLGTPPAHPMRKVFPEDYT